MRCSPKLPDPAICKTRCVSNNVWECLVADPVLCPFLSRFGHGYYCNYSDRRGFENKDRPKKKPLNERIGDGKND